MKNSKKKNVLVLMPQPLDKAVGGIGRLILYSLHEIGRNESQYQYITLATRPIESRYLIHISTLYSLLIFLLYLLFKKIDLLHIHVAPRGSTWRKAIFAYFGRLLGKPVVLHLHGSGYNQYFASQNRWAKSLIRAFFASADAVIVLGDGWRDWATSKQGLAIDLDRVEIIDNGVPDPGICADRSNDVPCILFVGVVGYRKGMDILLEALSGIKTDLPWVCTICGNGEVVQYTEMARSLGIGPERIRFCGWQGEVDIRKHMSASDIYVLPSRAENQPIAILEAMAIGLPVVASDVGDIPNQVRDGVTGRVIPANDCDALRCALEELLLDKSLRENMGDAGRVRFVENYSISTNVLRTWALYERILNKLN